METRNRRNSNHLLSASHIEDLKHAAAKMLGVDRRSFQAEMTLKYCKLSPKKKP